MSQSMISRKQYIMLLKSLGILYQNNQRTEIYDYIETKYKRQHTGSV